MRTVVVVPAYEEEAALPDTLAELRAALPEIDVVVVDDGSRDGTSAAARRAGVHVLRLPFNLGVGGAVRAGLRFGVERGFDRAVVIDADGQHEPASVRALLAALDGGADMAVGSRFAAGTEAADLYPIGRLRRAAMRSLSGVVRLLSRQRFTDTTSGFRAFDRPVMTLLARDYPVEYLADTVEVLLMVQRAGFTVVEVPAPMRPRAGGVASSRHFKLVFNYARLLIGVVASATRRPPRREPRQ